MSLLAWDGTRITKIIVCISNGCNEKSYMKLPGFAKDVAILTGGKAVATTIRIATIPVISRLFEPDVYGAAALYVSLTTILATIGIFSFPQAVVLPEEDDKAVELIGLTCVSLVIVAIILWACMLGEHAMNFSLYPELDIWLWSLPIAMLLQGTVQAIENWLIRHRHFSHSAVGDITQSTVTSSTRIFSGFLFGSLLWPLIGSYLLGLIGRLVVYAKTITLLVARIRHVTLTGLLKTVREFRQFPIYNTPASLVFSLNTQLPVLVIGYLFSAREVGHYAMVYGLLFTTVMVMGAPVRQAYLHRAARGGLTARKLRTDYLRTTGVMGLIGIPFAVILILYSESLFPIVLGDEWAESGRYAAVLTVSFYLQWLAMPAAALVVRLRRQRFWFYFQQAVLYAQAIGMAGGYMVTDEVIAVLTGYVIARSLLLVFLLVRVDYMILQEVENPNSAIITSEK